MHILLSLLHTILHDEQQCLNVLRLVWNTPHKGKHSFNNTLRKERNALRIYQMIEILLWRERRVNETNHIYSVVDVVKDNVFIERKEYLFISFVVSKCGLYYSIRSFRAIRMVHCKNHLLFGTISKGPASRFNCCLGYRYTVCLEIWVLLWATSNRAIRLNYWMKLLETVWLSRFKDYVSWATQENIV